MTVNPGNPAGEMIGVLSLRNSVLFPHAVMPISVGRRKTLALIESALEKDLPIAVVSQKDPSVDDPGADDLYEHGTVARPLSHESHPGETDAPKSLFAHILQALCSGR